MDWSMVGKIVLLMFSAAMAISLTAYSIISDYFKYKR